MTLNDLQELIDNMIEEGHGDRPVLIAEQPSYPLAATFQGIYAEEDDEFEDETSAIWLVAGANTSNRNPYSVPRDAWEDAMSF